MNSFANTPSSGRFYIYDDRLGYRYFATREERDAYYDGAQWIDQKHWSCNELGEGNE